MGGRENDFQEEGIATSEMVTLLNGIQTLQKFEEWLIALSVTGHANKCGYCEPESAEVDVCTIAPDDSEAFKLPHPLIYSGG